MTYEYAVMVLLSAWGIGFVLGFKLKQIFDALNAC